LARMLALPAPRIATNRVVAARIAQPMQILEQADQRQTLPQRLARILRQHPIQIGLPTSQFGLRLNVTLIGKRRLPRAQNLAHGVARHPQVARDLLDRLALGKMFPPYPPDRLHNQHPPTPASERSRQPSNQRSGGQFWTPIPRLRGSIFHAETQATLLEGCEWRAQVMT